MEVCLWGLGMQSGQRGIGFAPNKGKADKAGMNVWSIHLPLMGLGYI